MNKKTMRQVGKLQHLILFLTHLIQDAYNSQTINGTSFHLTLLIGMVLFGVLSFSLLLTRATLLGDHKIMVLVSDSLIILLVLHTSDSCRRRLFSEKLLGESDMEEGSKWKLDT